MRPIGVRHEREGVLVDSDERYVVAIDGPSGTGKSTVARRLASALDARYLDTGAMYRAVTWAALDAGIDPDDTLSVTQICEKVTLDSVTDPVAPHISVDGRRLDVEVRSAPVTRAVSAVAAIPEVRVLLVTRQREIIAETPRIVVEGRDIASVVAPNADLKVYLTASAAERARRRNAEFAGEAAISVDSLAATREDIDRRDLLDSSRAADPLRRADDAIEVDTTGMDIDTVVSRLRSLARQKAAR